MAITVLYGPGGAGKSLFQMYVLVEQLRTTRRNIVTNLSVLVPKLQAWLERTYPAECIDAGARIRILTESEIREFWKHRGPIRWTGNEYDMEEDKGANGVCYIIDEAGAAGFDAQGWASSDGRSSRGTKAIWYLDQQRKFGDDVFASTNGRTPAQIAKPFRDKAHNFIALRNEYLAVYGVFKGRGRFTWKQYQREPTDSNRAEPIKQGIFRYGSGLEDCYQTEKGVGVVGGGADKGAKAKGIPIMWVVPGALVLSSLCVLVPMALGKLGASAIAAEGQAEKAARAAARGEVSGAPLGASSPVSSSASATPRRGRGETYLATEDGASIVRYYVDSNTVRVELSNGVILDRHSPRLGSIGRDWVEIDGERIAWRAAPSAFYTPPPPPAVVSAPSPAAVDPEPAPTPSG